MKDVQFILREYNHAIIYIFIINSNMKKQIINPTFFFTSLFPVSHSNYIFTYGNLFDF